MFLHEYVESITVCVDGAPELLLFTIDRNDNLIEVPFVSCSGAIPLDAIGKVATETVHPKPDGFAADNHAAFGKQILHISCAEGKTTLSPYSKADDLTRKA